MLSRKDGERDGVIKLWDAKTGKEALALKGGYTGCAWFSPNGSRIAAQFKQSIKVLTAE